jgi:hypothetical protein
MDLARRWSAVTNACRKADLTFHDKRCSLKSTQQLASGFQIAIVLASDHEAMLAVDQLLEQLVAVRFAITCSAVARRSVAAT